MASHFVANHKYTARSALLAGLSLVGLSLAGLSTIVAPSVAYAGLLGAGERVELSSHRAIYDLSLDETDSGGIAALSGRIVFEAVGSACEGHAETLRFVTRSDIGNGKTMVTDLQSSTFELGATFEFVQRTLVNGQELESIRGRAEKVDDLVHVDLLEPDQKSLTIPMELLFPSAHMQAVIAAAKRGEHFLDLNVFDGSEDGETVSPVTTVIGVSSEQARSPGKDDLSAVASIKAQGAWPVVFSYFDADARMEETAPAYQMSGLLYDNGIIRKLHFDYGDYSINGRLVDIEYFPQDPCPVGE